VTVELDDGEGGTFTRWTPRTADALVSGFALHSADAIAFADALAAARELTARVTLSDAATARPVTFRVDGFARFWTGAGAVLGACR
jgi:hypothetical protein